MPNSIIKNVATEAIGTTAENAFVTLVTAAGFPALALAVPLAKGLVLGVVENCFNDCNQMTLSVNEKKKLNQVSSVALQTFWELAEKDGVVAWQMSIAPAYIDYAYEVAEHATMEAIRQSEKKKVDILGHFYGKQFYNRAYDWQDMHQMISMAGILSFRQIVLIRLIGEKFEGINTELFITNPSACVEVNRMRDYGLWLTDMAMFKNDSSASLQLKILKPTAYTKVVCEALMLEKISDEDIKMIVDSLMLSEDGEPAEGITKEDYEATNLWTEYNEEEEKLNIRQSGKNAFQATIANPEDIVIVNKGQNLMIDAKQDERGGYWMSAIDIIIKALDEYKKIKSKTIYQSSIDEALKELIGCFEYCEQSGGLRILNGKRAEYDRVIDGVSSEYKAKCKDYLYRARERNENYDKEQSNSELSELLSEV